MLVWLFARALALACVGFSVLLSRVYGAALLLAYLGNDNQAAGEVASRLPGRFNSGGIISDTLHEAG